MGNSKHTGRPGHTADILEGTDVACVSIDSGTGEITDANDAAAGLLGTEVASLCGKSWSQALGCSAAADSALAQAILAGAKNALAPFIIRSADGREMTVGGLLLPRHQQQGNCVALLLWQLLDEDGLGDLGTVSDADIVAVLGLDQLAYDRRRGAPETTRLMLDIRSSLPEIVRSQDTVGAPAGASVGMVLRDVTMAGAQDISRALLSHLHGILADYGAAVATVRLCVGLAQMTTGKTPLSTLLAANDALLLAQCGNGVERIRAAAAGDRKLLAARTINQNGVFCDRLASTLPGLQEGGEVARGSESKPMPPVKPIEKGIEGYVGDNMEGAVDQAFFLAKLDVPVAVIGPGGTGKMYVAKIIQQESGGAPDSLVAIDCREFRNRGEANARIARELVQAEGKTLVFKSPHLMHAEVQVKLARQISSRTLADVSPPQYLPRAKLVALFPDELENLIRQGSLTVQLASAFAAYPIHVPPIKDRKQAVLRWAHKILEQEGASRERDMKGFTPDAEQAMLLHDWPGNISEMRQCIADAMAKTEKEWITPVDLGLFKGITQEGIPYLAEPRPFLGMEQADDQEADSYVPSALEAIDVAFAEAVNSLVATRSIKPLGAWTDDEVVLAVLDRYRQDMPRAAEFLHTKPRNISRWLPKIQSREGARAASSLWQEPRRLLREWIRESPQLSESPLQLVQDMLIAHVNRQGDTTNAVNRARIMGVSTPTYLKRLRETQDS